MNKYKYEFTALTFNSVVELLLQFNTNLESFKYRYNDTTGKYKVVFVTELDEEEILEGKASNHRLRDAFPEWSWKEV